jgi:hypothetical protein
MTPGIIGIGLLVAFYVGFWSYHIGFREGYRVARILGVKSIDDGAKSKETELAKNISNSYNKQ